MEVIIDDKFSILVDPHNYTLIEYTGGVDSRGYANRAIHGHFQSIDRALKRLAIVRVTQTHDKIQIDEFIEALRREAALLRDAVEWDQVLE